MPGSGIQEPAGEILPPAQKDRNSTITRNATPQTSAKNFICTTITITRNATPQSSAKNFIRTTITITRNDPIVLRNILHPEPDRFHGTVVREEPGRMRAVRGQEMVCPVRPGSEAKVPGEGHDTASAVAAHHSSGAVGIEEFHPEIISFRHRKDHQSIRTDSRVTVAKSRNPLRREFFRGGPGIIQQEIIPRSVVFQKFCHFLVMMRRVSV